MRKIKSPRLLCLLVALFLFVQNAFSQTTVSGTVTDQQSSKGIPNVSVTVKGTNVATITDNNGGYRITAPSTATLVFSSVGYGTVEVAIAGKTTVDAIMTPTNASLSEVVVIGYGTARKRDLTGSVASVQAKDFNKGVVTNPDQLLVGKVSGLQIINSSGQPGAVTIVKIRGNNSIRSGNTPLYVVDGIPLDGRSPRPGIYSSGFGSLPNANPLTYLNPSEIASIDVLKDASSAAIYGSRGANGVILITTKKGQNGPSKIEVAASVGSSDVMRKIKVLSAGEYRSALTTYNAPKSDSGTSLDPFKEILNKGALTQNYSAALSGGNNNGKYRASFLYSNQDGIIRKSALKKYVGDFNGQYRFLDNRLSLDFNIIAANVAEQIAPISNDAGSDGNIISLALIWNPTLVLKRSNGIYNQTNASGQINPLAFSDAYNDHTDVTTILGSASAGYKISNALEYKFLFGVNYGNGNRQQEIQGWLKTYGAGDGGSANVSSSQLFSETVTHTLNFNKSLTSDLSLNLLGGYEYWKTVYKGSQMFAQSFDLNLSQGDITPNYHYYDNINGGDPNKYRITSFKDPSVELQSYFARAVFNYREKYLLTGTIRVDGSSKFGKNNRYGYFPSIAAAWNISNEDFMKSSFFNNLKLRLGYGETGNQEFNPVDAALQTGSYSSYNNFTPSHFGNPDLKWETVTSVDAGIDFGILHNRVWGFIDYFNKTTKNPILDFVISQPTAGSGTVFKNMDGKQAQKATVTNKGVEVSIGAAIVENTSLTWNVSANATFLKNKFVSEELANVPYVKNTGGLHGQGSSGAYSQVIANGQPIDVYYLPQFLGFDKTSGIAQYSTAPIFAGDPNPKMFVGFSTDLTVKKFTVTVNMHGNFGNKIFNNTAMSVLNISNIVGGRNIASNLIGNGENPANAITPSTRFLESGDFMKLGNLTVNYNIGEIGHYVKGANVYVSGSNLFVITKYTGFDPEVNVDKTLNGVPSLGVDYIGYPTARTIVLGVNFSL